MPDDSRMRIRVEMRASVGGAGADGAMGPDFAALLRRAARRLGVAVEAVEPRAAPSGLASQALGGVRGVEDPNIRHAAAVHAFNPSRTRRRSRRGSSPSDPHARRVPAPRRHRCPGCEPGPRPDQAGRGVRHAHRPRALATKGYGNDSRRTGPWPLRRQ